MPMENKNLSGATLRPYLETQENRPFHKKMASLDGAISYLRMAMETYPGSRATIEEINEDIWKYRITVEKMQTDQTDRR